MNNNCYIHVKYNYNCQFTIKLKKNKYAMIFISSTLAVIDSIKPILDICSESTHQQVLKHLRDR